MPDTTLPIAIQGGRGSFHHQAAMRFFESTWVTVAECKTFEEIFEALNSGSSDFGVMAVENSTAGPIFPNFKLLQKQAEKNGIRIIGETEVPVSMCLMRVPSANPDAPIANKMADIKQVISHPIALEQCREFLMSFPHVIDTPFYDTADAAKHIAENQLRDTAAIAPGIAAEIYGLEVIAQNIQNHKQNFTRFLILAKNPEPVPNADKATIFFTLPHEKGALNKVLTCFSLFDVNLDSIHSLLNVEHPDDKPFVFFVECEWADVKKYKDCIEAIVKITGEKLTVMGEYKNMLFKGAYQNRLML